MGSIPVGTTVQPEKSQPVSSRDFSFLPTFMNSNEQSRLIEIMADLLVEVQGMRQEQRETNQRLDRLEKRTEQNTAAVGELRVSFVRLADKVFTT